MGASGFEGVSPVDDSLALDGEVPQPVHVDLKEAKPVSQFIPTGLAKQSLIVTLVTLVTQVVLILTTLTTITSTQQ